MSVFNVSQPRDYELIVEKDVQIATRDGALLYADVYRPDGAEERFPAIVNMSVYQIDTHGCFFAATAGNLVVRSS
jgi:predicted acyl esterase